MPTSEEAARANTGTLKLRKLVPGEVLVREGDPPGAIYVIRAGRLHVFRRDPTSANGTVDLATLGVGEVIGELAAILRKPRSATVQALEPTQVMEIPVEHLASLLQQHQPLLRVVALALRERSQLAEEDVTDLVAKIQLALPPQAASVAPASTPQSQGKPAFTHDPNVVYPKTVDCPACGTRFASLTVRTRKDLPADRESDFHLTYRSAFNPYDYELWVCPTDLYAALPADFPDLRYKHRPLVASTVVDVVASWGTDVPDFKTEHALDVRQKTLELAWAQYQMREMPHVRVAAIAHRLAWCARERGDRETEVRWLTCALDHYRSAYSTADLGAVKEELRVLYLCGELSLRIGDPSGAVASFAEASRHPDLKDHPGWEKILREQWATARSTTPSEAATT